MSTLIRTRFAPSPTGEMHLGNLRSALYPWAFARKMQGKFILRIEDTDQKRSSQQAVDSILSTLSWLNIDFDEGPFYQTQRQSRYQTMIQRLLDQGLAYPCYMQTDELDALREAQRLRGEKPRYDQRWRPNQGKTMPKIPADIQPVIRFCNPTEGEVIWHDAVKGTIKIANAELDDLVIQRADGTPTYNFCVVVDDLDMKITHVIRGDDHVNNTPRQINMIRALGGTPPIYAHLPTILSLSGKKMSKRDGEISVEAYRQQGYLPEAILNYLARLGWSHKDEEIFTREQFIAWFDLEHLSHSAAQHNPKKLDWLNHHYLLHTDDAALAALLQPYLKFSEQTLQAGPPLKQAIALLKPRTHTLVDLAEQVKIFYIEPDFMAVNIPQTIVPAWQALQQQLTHCDWQEEGITAALKAVLEQYQLKTSALAMPLRAKVCGSTQTPAIEKVLALFDRQLVLSRLRLEYTQSI